MKKRKKSGGIKFGEIVRVRNPFLHGKELFNYNKIIFLLLLLLMFILIIIGIFMR
ncbi:hypothetical protein GOV12_03770 [Candidatus Pacearchaeota archaeon]|nr:hypothetical protein [Candidatus Pacearchaeota archaeon]